MGIHMASGLRGLPTDAISDWLCSIPQAPPPPYEFNLVPGGRTNLTYQISSSDGRSLALRRPSTRPGVSVPHRGAWSREFQVTHALSSAGFPAPIPVAMREDLSVAETPFTVFEWAEGQVVNDDIAPRSLSNIAKRASGVSFAETLARLHRIEPGEVGLSDWVRPGTFVERQVKAWLGQTTQALASSSLSATRRHGLSSGIASGAELLLSNQPTDLPHHSILHGDYRLDNLLLSADRALPASLTGNSQPSETRSPTWPMGCCSGSPTTASEGSHQPPSRGSPRWPRSGLLSHQCSLRGRSADSPVPLVLRGLAIGMYRYGSYHPIRTWG
jgi:aminoglycoside phosphotransferase (APT) family kinase protein